MPCSTLDFISQHAVSVNMDMETSYYWQIDCDVLDHEDEAESAAMTTEGVLRHTARFRALNAFIYTHVIVEPDSSSHGAISAYTPGPDVEHNPSVIMRRWQEPYGYDVHALVKVLDGAPVSEFGLRTELVHAIEYMPDDYKDAYPDWMLTRLSEQEFNERYLEDEKRALHLQASTIDNL